MSWLHNGQTGAACRGGGGGGSQVTTWVRRSSRSIHSPSRNYLVNLNSVVNFGSRPSGDEMLLDPAPFGMLLLLLLLLLRRFPAANCRYHRIGTVV